MIDTRHALKAYFSDGELPTGDNFAELIDNMALDEELAQHKDAFETFKAREAMSVGTGDGVWRLSLTETGAELGPLGPDLTEALTVTAPVHAGAARGMPLAVDAVAGAEARIVSADLPELVSDGTWQKLLDPPGRPVALHLTAASALPPGQKVTVPNRVWRLIGRVARGPALLHATALTSGHGSRVHPAHHIARPGIFGAYVLPALLALFAVALVLWGIWASDYHKEKRWRAEAAAQTVALARIERETRVFSNAREQLGQMASVVANEGTLFQALAMAEAEQLRQQMINLREEQAALAAARADTSQLDALEIAVAAAAKRFTRAEASLAQLEAIRAGATTAVIDERLLVAQTRDRDAAAQAYEDAAADLQSFEEDGAAPEVDRMSEITAELQALEARTEELDVQINVSVDEDTLLRERENQSALRERQRELRAELDALEEERRQINAERVYDFTDGSSLVPGISDALLLIAICAAVSLVLLATALRLLVGGISRRAAVVDLRWKQTDDGPVLQVRGPRYGKAPGSVRVHGTLIWG
ncbi:MAG: hypothetical protein AAFQ19_13805 [Pseudomonadota bacterium]